MADLDPVRTTVRDPQIGTNNQARTDPPANERTTNTNTTTRREEDTFERRADDPARPNNNNNPTLLAQNNPPAQPLAGHTENRPPLRAPEAITGSRGTFELASRELEAGRGERASELLRAGATDLRRSIPGANATDARALTTIANNMDARAAAYGETAPSALRERAGALAGASREARNLSEELQRTHPELSRQLGDVGLESRLQAEVMWHAAENTDVLLGRGVGQTYRAIANGSFDHAINNTGSINNFFTGARDQLQRDREKVNSVFDTLDRKMQREGISFDRAWNSMFEDHRINSPDRPPGFATAGDAAAFLRDHQVTRGLLSPMADIARNLTDGNNAGVDRAKGDLVQALRTNGQWDIARNVLDDLQKNAGSNEGRDRAQALNDSERREWWTQKAGDFVQKDLPVLLLSTAVSGGVGLGARALATAATWGPRAVRGAQIAAEIGSFVPTERVLNDVINNRRADWSAGGLARDYAITAGGYGLFQALGAGWRALRAPKAVAAEGAEAITVGGRPTNVPPREAPENIRALTRENESAQVLGQNGFRVEQNPAIPGSNLPGVKRPDYRVGGELFDNFAPTTGSARNIWSTVEGKVTSEQARRIVLNLNDSAVSMEALRKQFAEWPINGLEQVLVVKNGNVFSLNLARPQTALPIVPRGYPHRDN